MREFDHSDLWGNIGGYVGMFLGISLWQLPLIIASMSSYLLKKLSKEARPRSNRGNRITVINDAFRREETPSVCRIESDRQRLYSVITMALD